MILGVHFSLSFVERGIVTKFSGNQNLPVVRFTNGKELRIGLEKWNLKVWPENCVDISLVVLVRMRNCGGEAKSSPPSQLSPVSPLHRGNRGSCGNSDDGGNRKSGDRGNSDANVP